MYMLVKLYVLCPLLNRVKSVAIVVLHCVKSIVITIMKMKRGYYYVVVHINKVLVLVKRYATQLLLTILYTCYCYIR